MANLVGAGSMNIALLACTFLVRFLLSISSLESNFQSISLVDGVDEIFGEFSLRNLQNSSECFNLATMTKGVIGLTLIVNIIVAPAFASTPPKSGLACPKLGITNTYGGKKFTCIKTGKKLVWNKGEAVAGAPRSPSKSPQTSTLTPTPSSQTTSQSPGTSTLEVEYLRIKKMAFENIRKAADNGDAQNIEINYRIGAEFPLSLKTLYSNQVDYASKLYGPFFAKRETINIYMYTEKDALALKNDPAIGHNYSEFERWFNEWQSGNMLEHSIGIASFYVDKGSGWQGYAGLAVSSSSTIDSLRKYSIQVMPHEYFHIVQDYFITSQRNSRFPNEDAYDRLFPPVFREGSANTLSFALSCKTFEDYLSLYSTFLEEKRKQVTSVPTFGSLKTANDVVQTLKSIEVRSKNPDAHEASYSIGQLLFEYVIAEYGFEGFKRLVLNQLVGSNFEENVRASLGLSLDELYKKAANHIMVGFRGSI